MNIRKTLVNLAIILIFMLPAISFGSKVNFSEHQKDNLKFACDYGKTSDIEHEDICYIFSAIMWKESSARTDLKDKPGHHSYGPFQIYLPTLKNRFKQKGLRYSDAELKELMKDRYYSATFAEEELSSWLKVRKGDMFKALASYNAGYNWKISRGYARDVLNKASYLKKHGDFLEN